MYLDLHDKHRGKTSEKESILDDVVFEIELIKQIDVNIDYILCWSRSGEREKGDDSTKDGHGLADISAALDASPSLRSKKDLILAFIEAQQGHQGDVTEAWQNYLAQQRETELAALIAEERLNNEKTRALVDDAFRDGAVSTLGTSITSLMPPVSRFSATSDLGASLNRVSERILAFFERFSTL